MFDILSRFDDFLRDAIAEFGGDPTRTDPVTQTLPVAIEDILTAAAKAESVDIEAELADLVGFEWGRVDAVAQAS